MKNLDLWNQIRTVPEDAKKTIMGGRLKGMTDISPMWRYMELTRHFGPCGFGWKYVVEKLWTENGVDDQVCAFASVNLFLKKDGEWSEPIPGIGGSMLTAKEKSGLHTSDEAYKMAVTDALSVCCKMLGMGADVYWSQVGQYSETPDTISNEQIADLEGLIQEVKADTKRFTAFFKIKDLADLPASQYESAVRALEAKRKAS